MILHCLWTSPLVSLFYMQLTEEVNSISAIISLWSAPEVNLPPVQRKWCCILLFAQLPFPLIIFGPWDGGLYKCCFAHQFHIWTPSAHLVECHLILMVNSSRRVCFLEDIGTSVLSNISDEDLWHGLVWSLTISLSKLQFWEQCRYNDLFIRK